MEFHGRYSLPARPDMVWAALHDPAILAACIPGCEGVSKLSATEYAAQATLKIGPVKARFTGKVTWTDHVPPEGHTHAGTLVGEGQGGAAGFARGEFEVRLAQGPDSESAVLTYEAKANVGGKLAQIGQRLIDAAAKSIADQFFANFATLIRTGTTSVPGLPDEPVSPAPVENAPMVPASHARTTTRGRGASQEAALRSQVWLVGLVGIVIILLFFFSLVL